MATAATTLSVNYVLAAAFHFTQVLLPHHTKSNVYNVALRDIPFSQNCQLYHKTHYNQNDFEQVFLAFNSPVHTYVPFGLDSRYVLLTKMSNM